MKSQLSNDGGGMKASSRLKLLRTPSGNVGNCQTLMASREGKTPVCLKVESFRLRRWFLRLIRQLLR